MERTRASVPISFFMTEIDALIELAKSAPQAKPKADPRTLNAYRHGLTGHVRFTTPADEQAYKKHCAGYLEDFRPKGAVETDLVQALADGRWRIKRAAQMENAIVAITLGQPDQMKCEPEQAAIAFAHAYAWLDRGKDLNLLTLYERRLQRAFIEDFKLLEMIQAQRHQRELAEARTPSRLAPQSRKAAPPPTNPNLFFQIVRRRLQWPFRAPLASLPRPVFPRPPQSIFDN
jgi:hypothetical protein